MIVLKFGGTSVQDAAWIDKAIDITHDQIGRAPVMVSSAMGKTTDRLVDIMRHAEKGEQTEAFEILQGIRDSHENTAHSFLTGEVLETAMADMEKLFTGLTALTRGLSLLQEISPRSTDAVLSYGERLSTLLIAARCRERGYDVLLHDARQIMITDSTYTRAEPIWEQLSRRIPQTIQPQPGLIHVTQGFVGADEHGITTTLGRGGSDYTAALLGAALNAEEVQIWTDVTGIMTCDPRIAPRARTIDTITYDEAAELAYFGAKVVHPSTIQPAVKHNIPVYVKNTRAPGEAGTLIHSEPAGRGLRAIASKNDITLITIRSSRMLNAYGFLSRLFAIFEKHETPVDLVSTSEVSVSMSIEDTSALEAIMADLQELGETGVENNLSIICLVGQDLWQDSQVISRVFKTLDDRPVRMVSLGSSDINLSIVVADEISREAVRQLHDGFFPAEA